jgi:hypothetical protein
MAETPIVKCEEELEREPAKTATTVTGATVVSGVLDENAVREKVRKLRQEREARLANGTCLDCGIRPGNGKGKPFCPMCAKKNKATMPQSYRCNQCNRQINGDPKAHVCETSEYPYKL